MEGEKEMLPIYNNRSEVYETVYTYDEWIKEHNRRETQRRSRQRAERLYYIKQRLSGLAMAMIGIISPFLLDGDATVSLFALPLGIFLMLTREKVMILQKGDFVNMTKTEYGKCEKLMEEAIQKARQADEEYAIYN